MAGEIRFPLQHRLDSEENWSAANPVLLHGEPGYCQRLDGLIGHKCGDGIAHWNDLPWAGMGSGDGVGTPGPQGADGAQGPIGPIGPAGPQGFPGEDIEIDDTTITRNTSMELTLADSVKAVLAKVDTPGSVKEAIAEAVADSGGGGSGDSLGISRASRYFFAQI